MTWTASILRARPLLATRAALVATALALTAVGILFVHSTTVSDGEGFPSRSACGQIIKAAVSFAVFAVAARLDYRLFARLAPLFYSGMIAVLATLLWTRDPTDPTARWIDLRIMTIQPSELMKLAVILALARHLRYDQSQRRIRGLALPCILVLVPMFLIARQPDLGTSLMLPPVLWALLYVSGARRRVLVAVVVAGAVSLPLIYVLREALPLLRGYQMDRITGFFVSTEEVLENKHPYQLSQSILALGSGGLHGQGLGRGQQNRLDWLPEKQTDFIFGIVGEEWGFIGASGVAALFLILTLLCLRVAMVTREPFGRLVAAGVAVAFAAQSVQNMGMTMGLTPITGVPLPFVSSGGSSLLNSFFSLGLVVSVASRRVRVVASSDLDPHDLPRAIPLFELRGAGLIASRWPVR